MTTTSSVSAAGARLSRPTLRGIHMLDRQPHLPQRAVQGIISAIPVLEDIIERAQEYAEVLKHGEEALEEASHGYAKHLLTPKEFQRIGRINRRVLNPTMVRKLNDAPHRGELEDRVEAAINGLFAIRRRSRVVSRALGVHRDSGTFCPFRRCWPSSKGLSLTPSS